MKKQVSVPRRLLSLTEGKGMVIPTGVWIWPKWSATGKEELGTQHDVTASAAGRQRRPAVLMLDGAAELRAINNDNFIITRLRQITRMKKPGVDTVEAAVIFDAAHSDHFCTDGLEDGYGE